MKLSAIIGSSLLLAATLSAAQITIKVVDSQSAAVPGAQVELFQSGSTTPLAVESTSAEGLAVFNFIAVGFYRARVLARGFAPETIDVAQASPIIRLQVATAAETVVVTATRTPVPSEAAGASVESLSAAAIQTMNPVAADDALRFLPGAVVNAAGQRGGLASLFVRGGDSTYNKVIVDGVTINQPGGTSDFGTVPLAQADQLEFVRGAQSTLYGSDAMTSVVQVWTRTGTTPVPELRFGADGGNFGTASGYASLAGANGRFDYNFFGNQFNTLGRGPNDDYSNSLEGVNVGVALTDQVSLRLRTRHDNSVVGVQGEWNFNGDPLLQPDLYQRARQNNILSSLELTVAGPSRWQHRFTMFEDNQNLTNIDPQSSPGRIVDGFNVDTTFEAITNLNRAGFEYQGDYTERTWAHTTIGYRFEDENGFVNELVPPPISVEHGLRLNDDVYGQQQLTLGRLSVIAGARFVHNGGFGNTAVPRIALTLLALRGGDVFSGTRLRFSYATGIKEPLFQESFAGAPFSIPNPNLKPERNRAFEAGFQQNLFANKYALIGTYFNNLFSDQIEYATSSVPPFLGQYENVNKSFAQGAEVELQGRMWSKLWINTGYTYTSTQILQAPLCTPANFCDPLLAAGEPLLRRPKHSATALFTYLGTRWGANLGGSFVGRRADSDFYGLGITHAAGYVRVDAGGWYAFTSRVTAFVNIENLLDKQYQEVVGYPALGANFRAGMRFRFGGE